MENKNKKNKFNKEILLWIVISFVLTVMLEFIRSDEVEKITDIIASKEVFIVNYFIVLSTISIMLWFKRKYFVLGIISSIWIILGIISRFLVDTRGIPLTFSDIYSIAEGLAIADKYINFKNIVIFGVISITMGLGYAFLWKIKGDRNKMGMIASMIVICISTVGIYNIEKNQIFNTKKLQWDKKVSYERFGFAFSILNSCYSSINIRPEGYKQANLNEIKKNLNKKNENLETEYDNVIVLQLESFMDPMLMKGVTYSEDPLKNFREISREGISGQLQIPTFGGGTARSEFEVLTGINLDHMPSGIVPHVTPTGKKVIESMASILDKLDYSTYAIHNYKGNYYDRNNVFANLGFDNYISMEYMDEVKVNNGVIQDDKMIFDSIKNIINEGNDKNFIYGITVGTHGPYRENNIKEEPAIKISGDVNEKYSGRLKDYVNRVNYLDTLIGEFIDYVNKLDKDTLVVMYSDHLPSMYPGQDKDYTGDKYEAPYFIYSTKEIEAKNKDMEAYQLSSHLFSMMNVDGGVMSKYHDVYKNLDKYQENMILVQYDILNGKKYLYNGKLPYKKTDIKLGLKEIYIKDYEVDGESIKINGSGFNETSKVYLNEKEVETKYIDNQTLKADLNNIDNLETVSVKQLGRSNVILSSTDVVEVGKVASNEGEKNKKN